MRMSGALASRFVGIMSPWSEMGVLALAAGSTRVGRGGAPREPRPVPAARR